MRLHHGVGHHQGLGAALDSLGQQLAAQVLQGPAPDHHGIGVGAELHRNGLQRRNHRHHVGPETASWWVEITAAIAGCLG